MPSAGHSRSVLTFQPWTISKRNRHDSTGQELNAVQNDERTAALLHGRRFNQGEKAPSNSVSNQSATLSHHSAQNSNLTKQRNPPQTQVQRGRLDAMSRKRKATASLSQRPARKHRSNTLELKDEAYIRRTMRIPTTQEYPGLPRGVFKNTKNFIFDLAHGHQLAECRSEFTALDEDAFRCTAYYNSAMHNQVVIGEGRTKASRAVS